MSPENISDEHLCCIIRRRTSHPGIEAKRRWLADRLAEGHVFRKLDDPSATVFIEYAPLETAWVPIEGDGWSYLYCLWVLSPHRGKGYGRALLESCLADVKAQGRSGVCMLGAKRQKAWLSDQSFAKKFGFQCVDTSVGGYELLALSFDGSVPQFCPNAKRGTIDQQELTIYHDAQCPFIVPALEKIRAYCKEVCVPFTIVPVERLEQAKSLPCPFNNWAVFYQGDFQTVDLLDVTHVKKLLTRCPPASRT